MPPLPSPGNIVRLRLFWDSEATNEWGSRFFLSYTGGPPTSGDLDTLCTNVNNHYNTSLVPLLNSQMAFKGSDAVDLASATGNSGVATATHEGTRGSEFVPDDACVIVNFKIGRRYRGGKPKIFLPPGDATDIQTSNQWTSAYSGAVSSAWTTFMAAVLADTYGSMVLQDNASISYYEGFTAFKEPSGRYRNIPTPRTTPLVDLITGHTVSQLIGSQRRRRTSFVTP